MNWRVFYDVVMWTNRFWAWGAAYTIVKNRHIGLDIGTGRRAVNVPALQGGRVVIVKKTPSMGWVVVIDTGLPGARRYHAYCHLSAENLPRAGSWVGRNERVGRLASKSAREVPYEDPEYGGTAWDGIHLHLVFSDIAFGAYTLNTGAKFANPEDFIREALTGDPAAVDAKPFDPEEDDMPYTEDRLKDLFKIALTELKGSDGRNVLDSVIQTRAELKDRASEGAMDALYRAKGLDGRNLFDGVIQRGYDIAAVGAKVNAGGIDPAALARAIDEAGLAKDVADELAKRLAS